MQALKELRELVEERIKKSGMLGNMIKFVTTSHFKQESEKAQKKFNEAMRNLQFSVTVETRQTTAHTHQLVAGPQGVSSFSHSYLFSLVCLLFCGGNSSSSSSRVFFLLYSGQSILLLTTFVAHGRLRQFITSSLISKTLSKTRSKTLSKLSKKDKKHMFTLT